MTIISRRHGFIYLKSKKTAGTTVELHLLTRTPLGKDIWRTAPNIGKYQLPRHRRRIVLGTRGRRLFTIPEPPRLRRLFPWKPNICEHHDAASLAQLLAGFWEQALKVTNVRNPWDIMVSGWKWRREGRGGSPPVTASFEEWCRACLSADVEWQKRIYAYDARGLMAPFLFIDDRPVVDVMIRQEDIDGGLAEVGRRLGISLGRLEIHENQTRRKRDYRRYYSDGLAESVGDYFADVTELCGYRFDP